MKIGVSLPVREMAADLIAIRDFAQSAEELGFTHLRVPEQILRPRNKHLHEPMMLLAYIAGITEKIELCPSVVILPARQTVLFAKQAAELDLLSRGRVRLGIGVGSSKEEYGFLRMDFHNRGRRCDEQMRLLKELWTNEIVTFEGEYESVSGVGLNPMPVQRPLPLWVGGASLPSAAVVRRIGRASDGWFNLAQPGDFPRVRDAVYAEAESAGRSTDELGTETGVALVGPREAEWKDRVTHWYRAGMTHLCLRTLGGGLGTTEHIEKLEQAVAELPDEVR